MHPKEFLRTIYLGDRGCKSLLIDAWSDRVVLQVNEISRVRSASGNWEFYTDEDVVDGLIVFTGVESICFNPPGFIPNDFIDEFEVEPIPSEDNKENEQQRFLFKLGVGSVDKSGRIVAVRIEIVSEGVHLEDPARPGVEITE